MEVALFPDIPPVVENLRRHVKDLSEAVTLTRLFQIIPRAYQEFRETPDDQRRFFVDECEKSIKERALSEPEQDVLMFQALQFVRELADDIPANQTGVSGDVRAILARMRMFVCVDEAADFSPLEIACIERFAKLGSGGVTICGDLMQRVTEQGLKEWTDLADISEPYEGRELRVSYRQTERLFSIAKDLYRHSRGIEPDFKSAFPKRPEDPPPLLHKSTGEQTSEQWLTNRICEIHALCGQHLPTTAILVAHQDDVEPLRQKLKPILLENGLELEASHGGQALGDSARVRIFPVEFIKGLEFEAVFYVGLDRMAEIHKDLIDKYVYVGLSRARSFLGVTIERQFPQRLKSIANHFVQDGSWALNPEA
jgi:superfamily I DNA/RNA helicase